MLRTCLSNPIPEIFSVAKLLNDAVSAHLLGDKQEAVVATMAIGALVGGRKVINVIRDRKKSK